VSVKVGIPKEIHAIESRVAASPGVVKRLKKLGFEVLVERDAGVRADYSNTAYRDAGAQVVPDAKDLWSHSDIVLKVRPPDEHPDLGCHEVDLMREGGVYIGFIWPAQNKELLERFVAKRASVIAMDQVPRITRAQKLDALSSMANIAGYRAIVEAAQHFTSFFTAQMTAAGKVEPAVVLVIGAGVAGLAAIGAARSMGAMVRAFDTRPEVKEQVQSMGADFLEVDMEEEGAGTGGYAKEMSKEFIEAEMKLFMEQAQEVDIIVTTALIPGKKAPTLITREMVEKMKPGSVIVDLAAEQGGNCEVTRPGEVHNYNGVHILGYTDLPSRMAKVASRMYGTNLAHMLDDLGGNENFKIDLDDVVVRTSLVAHEGEITWPPPAPEEVPAAPRQPAPMPAHLPEPSTTADAQVKGKEKREGRSWVPLLLAGIALFAVGAGAPETFLSHLTVFVLSIFLGWQVIWNVTPALHTPLMSVTNAISGIIILGGMLQISGGMSVPVILGAVAIAVATINIAGGFLVTHRMLAMFRKE
jgi:NAD(P) transhydrogenase subunit alpha